MEENRILQKPRTYYATAMQQANRIAMFNQTTLDEDIHLHTFWCRYIHHLRTPYKTKMHSHSFFELHCILSGRFSYHDTEQTTHTLVPGQFLLASPQSKHYLEVESKEGESFAVTFNPIFESSGQGKMLQTRLDSITCIKAELTPEACQLIELIMKEFHDRKSFCTQNIKSMLKVLVINLIRDVFENTSIFDENEFACDPRVAALEKHLNDNQSTIFSVEDAAHYLNLGTKQLNNIIRLNLGISAKDFIDQIKTDQIRRLLLETDLNLQTISELLGFSDHNNFNRFFKRTEGLPPGEFRLSKGPKASQATNNSPYKQENAEE